MRRDAGYAALACSARSEESPGVHQVGANLMPGDLNSPDPYAVVRCPGREGREEQRTRHAQDARSRLERDAHLHELHADELLRPGFTCESWKDWVTGRLVGRDDGDAGRAPRAELSRVQRAAARQGLAHVRRAVGARTPAARWSTPHAAGGAAGGAAGTLHVFLDRGVNLKPADRNGFSDPYVKLTCHGVTHTSKTIKKSLDPQWRQSFQWSLPLSSLTARPDALQLECWDKDTLSRDDSLGHGAADLRGLLPNEMRDMAVPLSVQGTLHLRVQWVQEGGSGAPFAQPSRAGGGGGDACLPAAPTLPPPMAAPTASVRDDTSVSTFGTTARCRLPADTLIYGLGARRGSRRVRCAPFAASRLGWQPPAGSWCRDAAPTRPTAPSTTRTAPQCKAIARNGLPRVARSCSEVGSQAAHSACRTAAARCSTGALWQQSILKWMSTCGRWATGE